MKRLLIVMLMGFGVALVGCGSDEESTATDDEGMIQEETAEEEDNSTGDPLEFVDKSEKEMTFVDGANEYEILNYYVSDDTDEQGFNIYEDGDFTMRYALVETGNIADVDAEGNKEIQILGEIINDTDQDYNFDENRMFIKTDENEESSLAFGLNGAWKADQKSKFNDSFPLDYDTPDSFTLTLIDPSLEGDGDDVVFGDDWDRKFDEAFEEFKEEHTVKELEFTKE